MLTVKTSCSCYILYSIISPGWHSNTLQIDARVENRTAFALLFLRIERLAIVMPTFSESSVKLIFRLASMTSRLTEIITISLIRVLSQSLHREERYATESKRCMR